MADASDDDFLADRYVLGLLDPEGQAEVERRMAGDEAFAARVARTALRFVALDDAAPPVPLPEAAWARLERRLGAIAEPSAPSAPPVAPFAAPPGRRPVTPATTPANRDRAPARVLAALAAALVLTVGLAWSLLRETPAGPVSTAAAVAILLDPEGVPVALIEDFGGGDAAVTTLAAYAVPEGSSLQVWTKWSEEVGPVSLGVLDAFASAAVGAEGLPEPVAGQLYEITVEAEGGSATGRPTGPILGVGRATVPG